MLFTLVMPGTVGVYLPQWLKSGGVKLPLAAESAGAVLFLLGALVYFWCAWEFVSNGLGTPAPIDAPRLLVRRGLYRFTRNPMYLGVSAVIAGQALYYGAFSLVIYGAVVLAGFHLFVLFYEEPALGRRFGPQYEAYCRSVPRWVLPRSLPRSPA